jgi:hypothetical protein
MSWEQEEVLGMPLILPLNVGLKRHFLSNSS